MANFLSNTVTLGWDYMKDTITENRTNVNQSIFNNFVVESFLDHPSAGLASITFCAINKRDCSVIKPSFRVSIVFNIVHVRIQMEML